MGKHESDGIKTMEYMMGLPYQEFKAGNLRNFMKPFIVSLPAVPYAFLSFAQDLEAPGRWYQVILKCRDVNHAQAIINNLRGKSTIIGIYLDVSLLYELSDEQYKQIKKDHIDA